MSGALPFVGDSIATVILEVVNIDHRTLRDHVAELPASLEAVIDRALAKDPAQRFRGGPGRRGEAVRDCRMKCRGLRERREYGDLSR